MEKQDEIITGNVSRKKSRFPLRVWAGICVIIAVLAVSVGISYVISCYNGTESVRLFIPENMESGEMHDYLKSRLGVYGDKVYRLWSIMGRKHPHGSYVVKPDMSAFAAARMIARGRQTPLRLTFNNIRTMSQLAQRVSRIMECDSISFLKCADSVANARGYSSSETPALFLPDSYEFYWTASPADIVEKMADERDRFWNKARRDKAESIGLTPEQVAVVASIVEEETSKADERPLVARLYLNRLEKNMLLQADPTVKFSLADFGLRRITGAHLKVDSPYNTYRYKGLPPGPIRIAERSAIDAVLDAPQHPYIYMCAREDFSGYHNFAVDYSSHMRNARRYQQALDCRGIK